MSRIIYLEDARDLLRTLQGACDRADRAAYHAFKEAQAIERLNAELDAVVSPRRWSRRDT